MQARSKDVKEGNNGGKIRRQKKRQSRFSYRKDPAISKVVE